MNLPPGISEAGLKIYNWNNNQWNHLGGIIDKQKITETHYTINIDGLKRKLPLFEVARGVKIAIFNILGDTKIVVQIAKALAKKMPKNVEILVTPEVKSNPLVFELSKLLQIPYIRKKYLK